MSRRDIRTLLRVATLSLTLQEKTRIRREALAEIERLGALVAHLAVSRQRWRWATWALAVLALAGWLR